MKVYKKYMVFIKNKSEYRYFIFKVSKYKHNVLKSFCGVNDCYWFVGLTGANWYRGGFYHPGLINPSININDNVQGFTDGKRVYLLKDVRINKPTRIKEL